MAKFLTSLINNGNIKEGLSKGPQGVAHAALGVGEQFLTKRVTGRVLSGVGLVNPLLSVRIGGVGVESAITEVKRAINAQVLNPFEDLLGTSRGPGAISSPATKTQAAEESPIRGEVRTKPATEQFSVGEGNVTVSGPRTRLAALSQKQQRPIVQTPDAGEISEEFLQEHRFLVFDATSAERDGNFSVFEQPNQKHFANTLMAGFSFCDAPTWSLATTEIKEGSWEFPRTIPTGVESNQITMQKGVSRVPTGFYLWILNALRGNLTRRTLDIIAYGRLPKGRAKETFSNPEAMLASTIGKWRLYNCIPTGYRPAQNWDGNSGAVQLAELTVSYEWFEEYPGEYYKNKVLNTPIPS